MKNTEKKWFISNGGRIEGPWTPGEVEEKLPSTTEPLVWGRGMVEWVPPAEWRKALLEGGALLKESFAANSEEWKIRYLDNNTIQGPLTYADLMKTLKGIKNFSAVEIEGPDTKGWREIFELQKVVDELGISRRAYQRVPMMGHFFYETAEGETKKAKIVSISEGGVSLNEPVSVRTGEKIQATIRSPNLYVEIPCACEVVYAGPTSTGIRFRHLLPEGESAIIEYVNKFKNLGER